MCFVFVMTKMILVAAPANDRSTPEQTFGARSFLTLGMVGPQQRLGISLKEMRQDFLEKSPQSCQQAEHTRIFVCHGFCVEMK